MASQFEEQYKDLSQNLHNIKDIDHPIPKVLLRVIQEKKAKGLLAKEWPESLQKKYVFACPETVLEIENPSETVLKMALSKNLKLANHYDNLSVDIQKFIKLKDYKSCQYIKNMDEKLQEELVALSYELVQYINNPSLKVQQSCIAKSMSIFSSINNPHELVMKEIVKSTFFKSHQQSIVDYYVSSDFIKLSAKTAFILYDAVDPQHKAKMSKHPEYKSLASILLEEMTQ